MRSSPNGPPSEGEPGEPAARGQVFAICDLLVAFFVEPFFCLGFLASRFERFCSLFATTSSHYGDRGEYGDASPDRHLSPSLRQRLA